MPEKQKVYCGMKQQLPDGYDRVAIPFQCLRKGYGACLYANRHGAGGAAAIRPPRQPVQDRTLWVVVLLLLVLLLLFLLNKFFFPN